MATSRADLIAEARRYLGTPFLHQGRTVHGLDCIGLIVRVAHDLGLSSFDADGYSAVPSGRMMARVLAEQCEKIAIKDAAPGDLLHLSYAREPHHLVLLTDRGIIHADNQRGVIEHRLDDETRHRTRGAYCLPGIA